MSDEQSQEKPSYIGVLGFVEKSSYMNQVLNGIDQHEPNGRDAVLPYVDPFDAGDVLETALDAEIVAVRATAPKDQLDTVLQMEAHVENCEDCAVVWCKTCAHCLDLKVCEPVPVVYAEHSTSLDLCRACRTSAHEGRLTVYEARA